MTTLNDWLQDPNANPVVLLDLHHTEGIRRIGTQPYITRPDDKPANALYDDFVEDGLQLSAQLGANRSIGEIEFWGMDGEEHLQWAHYQAWIGDVNWPFAQFQPLSSGVIEQATRPARKKIRLALADPAKPLQSVLLRQKTDEVFTPLALGRVFNASPVLENSLTLTYRANQIPCAITAVRDNGVPVASYTDNNDGSFKLGVNPAGDITCDIEESHQTIEQACRYIASQKGINELSVVNFSAFQDQANIGLYVTDNDNAWDLLNQLCSSIGAFPRFNESGELELVHMPHSGAAELELFDDDVWQDAFQQSSVEPARNVQLNYRKNWAPQTNLAGAVTPDDRELYGREHTSIDIDNGVAEQELHVINTLLIDEADAQQEARRRAALWSQPRDVWRFEAVLPGLVARLGQRVQVQITGVLNQTGTVVGWRKRPDRKHCELEVLF